MRSQMRRAVRAMDGRSVIGPPVRDDEAYTKEVLVKLQHRGLDDPELRARFTTFHRPPSEAGDLTRTAPTAS